MCRILAKRWHDIRVRKLVIAIVAVFFLFATPQSSLADQTISSDTTVPALYDLENEPSQCIGLLPRPGCGKEPEDAGDRGGALQYTIFGLMMAGLGVIGAGMVRGVRKQNPKV